MTPTIADTHSMSNEHPITADARLTTEAEMTRLPRHPYRGVHVRDAATGRQALQVPGGGEVRHGQGRGHRRGIPVTNRDAVGYRRGEDRRTNDKGTPKGP